MKLCFVSVNSPREPSLLDEPRIKRNKCYLWLQAERVDAYLHTLSLKSDSPRPHLACFGTWILYHTLRIMIMYLLSGFELELYSMHEYHYIFW
jgi:hypothetical protein